MAVRLATRTQGRRASPNPNPKLAALPLTPDPDPDPNPNPNPNPKVAAPNLHALNYSDCFELRDAAVAAACEGCPELTKLQLAGCNGLRAPGTLGSGGIQVS